MLLAWNWSTVINLTAVAGILSQALLLMHSTVDGGTSFISVCQGSLPISCNSLLVSIRVQRPMLASSNPQHSLAHHEPKLFQIYFHLEYLFRQTKVIEWNIQTENSLVHQTRWFGSTWCSFQPDAIQCDPIRGGRTNWTRPQHKVTFFYENNILLVNTK